MSNNERENTSLEIFEKMMKRYEALEEVDWLMEFAWRRRNELKISRRKLSEKSGVKIDVIIRLERNCEFPEDIYDYINIIHALGAHLKIEDDCIGGRSKGMPFAIGKRR